MELIQKHSRETRGKTRIFKKRREERKKQSNSSSEWKFCFEDCDLGNTVKKKKQGLENSKVFTIDNYHYILYELYMPLGHLFRVFLFTLLLGTSWNPGHSCLDIHVKILITLCYLYICSCLYLWASFLFFSVLSSSYRILARDIKREAA